MRPAVKNTLAAVTALGAARAVLRQNRRMDFAGSTVMISGGSRGLGLELARCFAREGAALALLARDSAELNEAERELNAIGSPVLLLACDIREHAVAEDCVRRVLSWRGAIDVLVNNAGVIQVGPYENMEAADYENAVEVHLWAPLRMMQQVIPQMRRQGGGRIVNIASIGGKVAVPHLLPYSLSKFGLVGLSDGIRAELAKDRIRVTTVCPGLMRTGSHVNALFKGRHKREFALFAIANALPVFSVGSEYAARRIIEACRYGDPFLMIGAQARALHLINALFPNFTGELMSAVATMLPRPTSSMETRSGWESRSALAPRWLTKLSDAAIPRNNEELARGNGRAIAGKEA